MQSLLAVPKGHKLTHLKTVGLKLEKSISQVCYNTTLIRGYKIKSPSPQVSYCCG